MNQEPNKAQPLIEAAVQNLRTILNEQLVLLEESLRSSSGDVHAMVAERKSLVRKLKLDQKLTEIWEEVKNYPGWAKREESLKYRLCEIDDPKAQKRDKEQDISFLLNGHSYMFTYLDEGGTTGFDGDYLHHTHLSLCDASDCLLIEINISVEHDHYGSALKPFDIMGFIPGAWIQDFLECYEKFQANKKMRDIKQKYDSDKMAELKNKFGLE